MVWKPRRWSKALTVTWNTAATSRSDKRIVIDTGISYQRVGTQVALIHVMSTLARAAESTSRSNGSTDPLGHADPGLRIRPLTTGELAQMIGMSPTFIRDEIRGGYLRAVVVGRGRKRVYRIPVLEAYRYINELGIP